MFKVAFTSAVIAVASAQNIQALANEAVSAVPSNNQGLQNLANEANAALAPLLNEQNSVVQQDDSLYLNINNYEWALAEYNNEYYFSVGELAFNNNNLEPNLAALLDNTGEYLQNNSEAIANLLEAEAASLGVALGDQSALSSASQQYGAQLRENAQNIAESVNSNYQNAAQDFATNKNGLTTQVNQQINQAVNNEQGLTEAVSNAIASGLQQSGRLGDLGSAVNSNGNIAGLVASANNANLVNAIQSGVEQASGLGINSFQLGQNINAGANAGANAVSSSNLPSGLVNAAQNAAASTNVALNNNNNALNAATANVQNAASSLGGNQ